MPWLQVQKNSNRHEKAQSFVEVAIVLPMLLVILSGLAEFGFLLNEYLNLIDGPREAARQAGSFDYCTDTSRFYKNIEAVAAGCPSCGSSGGAVLGAINPMSLNPASDDVLVSLYQSSCSGSSCAVSMVGSIHSWAQDLQGSGPNGTTRFTPTSLAATINDGSSDAPSSGIVVVELYYTYHMVLGLPWLTVFLGNTIPVYAYTIMPLSIPTCSP